MTPPSWRRRRFPLAATFPPLPRTRQPDREVWFPLRDWAHLQHKPLPLPQAEDEGRPRRHALLLARQRTPRAQTGLMTGAI